MDIKVQNIRTIAQAVATNTYTFDIFDRPAWTIFMHLVYTSTSDVGNRQILFSLLDGSDNLVVDIHAGAVQAASNVYHYVFSQGTFRETAFVNNSIQAPWPTSLIVPAGYKLKVHDSTDVESTDSMAIDLQYINIPG